MTTTTTHAQTVTAVIADIQNLHERLEALVPLIEKDYPSISARMLDTSTGLIILAHSLVAPQIQYARDQLKVSSVCR